jgi:hypothetical protein
MELLADLLWPLKWEDRTAQQPQSGKLRDSLRAASAVIDETIECEVFNKLAAGNGLVMLMPVAVSPGAKAWVNICGAGNTKSSPTAILN